MSASHIMFVYGTLKRGQPNDYFMQELPSAKYCGCGITMGTYPLVVSSKHSYLPLLLKEESKGRRVLGEVYEVDTASLERLDYFEDHPNMYERFEIAIELKQDGTDTKTELKCWTYFFKNYDESDLRLEYLNNYDSNSMKGQEYDIRLQKASYGQFSDDIVLYLQ